MGAQESLTDQSSALSPRQRPQPQEQAPTRMDKTGEKDECETSSQQQQDDIMPPIGEMAENREQAIYIAAQKWKRFNRVMQAHITQLRTEASYNDWWGAIFRLSIIILSASVTVISAVVGDNQKYIATIVGGVLTALAGIEAYFRFNRRESEARRQQREIEALRYRLRHQWITTVQMENDVEKRFGAAIKFLQDGQDAYNVILNNYTLQSDDKNQLE